MADIGTGATITFGTNAFSGQIASITHSGITREVVETSHLGTTGGRTYFPGDLYDPGELELGVIYNASVRPVFTATAETITVVYPNGTATASLAASGFVTRFTPGNLTLEGLQEASVTVKLSGTITFA